MQWADLPILIYVIKNINTGKQWEYVDYSEAEDNILHLRDTRPGATFVMYAQIDI